MDRDTLLCDAVPGSRLNRRSVLLALPSLAAFAPMIAMARAEASGLGLPELVDADGSPSKLAHVLAQTQVRVRGYLAPSLDGREFTLTEGPATVCQLCGNLHDVGSSVAVRTDEPDPGAPVLQRVQVSGRLEVDSTVRLTAARIQVL